MNRENTIGGSDIAAIMGLSPWKTPIEVYHEKINNTNQDKPVLQRGRRAEKYILEEYIDSTGFTLSGEKKITSKEYPFLVGHIDAQVIDKKIDHSRSKISRWKPKTMGEYYSDILQDANSVLCPLD